MRPKEEGGEKKRSIEMLKPDKILLARDCPAQERQQSDQRLIEGSHGTPGVFPQLVFRSDELDTEGSYPVSVRCLAKYCP